MDVVELYESLPACLACHSKGMVLDNSGRNRKECEVCRGLGKIHDWRVMRLSNRAHRYTSVVDAVAINALRYHYGLELCPDGDATPGEEASAAEVEAEIYRCEVITRRLSAWSRC